MRQTQTFDIAIVGAGAVGLASAILLAQSGFSVLLIDAKAKPQPPNRRDARVFALSLSSIALLERIGVWQQICRRADYRAMQVWAKDGKGELNFTAPDDKLLGSMVEPAVLEFALYQQAKQLDRLTMLYDARCDALLGLDEYSDRTAFVVHHHDQLHHISAQIVIGADGRGSVVRQMMGVSLDKLDYHQRAICCAIRTQRTHQHTARQAMLPTGTLALLPLANIDDDDADHWQSIVWTLPEAMAADLLDLPKQMLAQRLAHELALHSGYALGEVLQVESIASFPLSAQAAKRYTKGRAALIGDAAHGVHPLAGQGLNLGLLDVAALVEILQNHQQKHGNTLHPRLLCAYERARKSHNSLMMHSFSLINFAFASSVADWQAFGWLRSEAVSWMSQQNWLINMLIKRANGA